MPRWVTGIIWGKIEVAQGSPKESVDEDVWYVDFRKNGAKKISKMTVTPAMVTKIKLPSNFGILERFFLEDLLFYLSLCFYLGLSTSVDLAPLSLGLETKTLVDTSPD